jgi:hypothetical protein
VEEGKMRNWYEMYAFGRDKASDLADLSRSIRAVRKTNAARERPATAATVVRLDRGRDAERAGATFVLQRDQVISIRARRRTYRVDCVAGMLWATIDGSPADSVLTAGASMTYQERGSIVIQALRTATVRIECPSPARVVIGSPVHPVFQLG